MEFFVNLLGTLIITFNIFIFLKYRVKLLELSCISILYFFIAYYSYIFLYKGHYIIFCILISIYFRKKNIKSYFTKIILSILYSTVYSAIVRILCIVMLDSMEIDSTNLYFYSSIILFSTSSIILYYLVNRFDYIYRVIETYNKYILSVFTTLFLLYICGAILADMNKDSNLFIYTVIILIFPSIFFSMSFVLLFKAKKKEKYIKNLEDYTEKLELVNEQTKEIRHDFKNIMLSFEYILNSERIDNAKLSEYYNNILLKVDNQLAKEYSNNINFKNINDKFLKSILIVKLIEAEQHGIKVSSYIPNTINKLDIEENSLLRIFGIIIDNAIEANLNDNIENPILNISLMKNDNLITAKISNSFCDNNISISKLFIDGYSTKGANRGYGLAILKKLTTDNNILLSTEIKDGLFIQTLDIKEK